MAGGAPRGNRNKTNGTMWKDAVRKALAKDKQALERVAVKLIKSAEEGDMAAIKELGDRLDGKAVQQSDVNLSGEVGLIDFLRTAAANDGK